MCCEQLFRTLFSASAAPLVLDVWACHAIQKAHSVRCPLLRADKGRCAIKQDGVVHGICVTLPTRHPAADIHTPHLLQHPAPPCLLPLITICPATQPPPPPPRATENLIVGISMTRGSTKIIMCLAFSEKSFQRSLTPQKLLLTPLGHPKIINHTNFGTHQRWKEEDNVGSRAMPDTGARTTSSCKMQAYKSNPTWPVFVALRRSGVSTGLRL